MRQNKHKWIKVNLLCLTWHSVAVCLRHNKNITPIPAYQHWLKQRHRSCQGRILVGARPIGVAELYLGGGFEPYWRGRAFIGWPSLIGGPSPIGGPEPYWWAWALLVGSSLFTQGWGGTQTQKPPPRRRWVRGYCRSGRLPQFRTINLLMFSSATSWQPGVPHFC